MAAVVLSFMRVCHYPPRRSVSGPVVFAHNPTPPSFDMKISRILAHRVELPLHETTYKWSGGKSLIVFDSTTAAIVRLAHSTPEEFRFTRTEFNCYVTFSTADDAPQRVNGFMSASTMPGLCITPKMDVLGKPVVVQE